MQQCPVFLNCCHVEKMTRVGITDSYHQQFAVEEIDPPLINALAQVSGWLMYRLSTRQVSTLAVPLLPPATTPPSPLPVPPLPPATTPPSPLAVPLLPPATTARPCKRKLVSEDDDPRQKFRTTTDSPCVFSLGDVVAINMSVNRFDFARVENNISKTKFEIYIIREEASIFAPQRIPFYKDPRVAACTVGKVRSSTVFMCVCSTFRPSDFLLHVKNGFVVGVRCQGNRDPPDDSATTPLSH